MVHRPPQPILTLAARDARRARVDEALRRLPLLACYPQRPLEVVEGALLSDAGITCLSPGSHGLLSISLSGEEHLDWLEDINTQLALLGLERVLNPPRLALRKNKKGNYMEARLWTRRDPFFTMMHRRWYPGGRKEVPLDLTLTPVSSANWFMGDGCSFRYSSGSVVVYFSTQSFSRRSTEHLKEGLYCLGIEGVHDSKPSRGRAPGVQLAITSEANVTKLMETVEPFVLPSYRYKIKYPRRSER